MPEIRSMLPRRSLLIGSTLPLWRIGRARAAEQAAGRVDMQQLAAAAEEGALTFYYAVADDVATKWVHDFSEQYGIDVSGYRANTDTVLRKYEQENHAGRNIADVLAFADMSVWQYSVEKGYIAKYFPQNANDFMAGECLPGGFYPLFFASYPVYWNTAKISTNEHAALLKDPLPVLLQPGFKGRRIGLAVPETTVTLYGAYSRIVADPRFGWDYMQKLANQKPRVYDALAMLQSDIVKGEVAVALAANDASVSAEIIKGAPVEFRYAEEPAISSAYGVAISAKAPHPNAARLFMEWATSPKAQQRISELMQSRAGSHRVEPPPEIAKYSWYAPPKRYDLTYSIDPVFQKNSADFMKRWNKVFDYDK